MKSTARMNYLPALSVALLTLLIAATLAPHAEAAVQEQTLHNFSGTPDGANPSGELIMDSAGNLYGTTVNGGSNGLGSVFRLAPDGTYTILYSFMGGSLDGANPYGSLVMDGSGNLYGTTRLGGNGGSPNGPGNGTVYRLTP